MIGDELDVAVVDDDDDEVDEEEEEEDGSIFFEDFNEEIDDDCINGQLSCAFCPPFTTITVAPSILVLSNFFIDSWSENIRSRSNDCSGLVSISPITETKLNREKMWLGKNLMNYFSFFFLE